MNFVVNFQDVAYFECIEKESGQWVCTGKIKRVKYTVEFENSADTLVFQHLSNLVKCSI